MGCLPYLLIAILAFRSADTQRQSLKLVVNGSSRVVPLRHFWQSTGFCPPLPHHEASGFDLSPDMVQNLAYIGAVPHSGIQQVRIHWLLDLVTVVSFSASQPQYNFSSLDSLVDLLHKNGLRPGFELMGSPSGIFTDMENKTQLYWWRDLVTQLARRYINTYGLNYVKQWNFETWNEPDCHDFDETKMTVQGFLNYYDACSEGLKAASPLLLFGGPGDGCDQPKEIHRLGHSTKYREALLGHVVNGTNYFTGETGVRLDFLSLHRKGNGSAINIIEDELSSMAKIRQQYPQLADKPFYNDEADPLAGWSKMKSWRATAAYAAMAIKVICQHQNMLLGSGGRPAINYTLLSNDNAFLSFYPHQFTQRTLLARFQMNSTSTCHNHGHTANSSSCSSSSRAHRNMGLPSNENSGENYVTFIRKPIHTAMVLLAKLGDTQLSAALLDTETGRPLANSSYAGCVASVHTPATTTTTTSDSVQWSVVVYTSSDTSLPTRWASLAFDWTIASINASDLMLAVYSVDDSTTNPYSWWDVLGRPDFPSRKQFEIMRKYEGPNRHSLTGVVSDARGQVRIPPMDLREPQVVLLHLCHLSPAAPEQVTEVRMVNITGGQVLIRWSDARIRTKCVKTFEVEHAQVGSKAYTRINTEDTVVNLFVYYTAQESEVRGSYRVRAVDYWQRVGPYSPIITYM